MHLDNIFKIKLRAPLLFKGAFFNVDVRHITEYTVDYEQHG